MTLLRPPLWALAIIGTPADPLAVLILEAGSTDSYTAMRTRLTLAGCINQISLPEWQHGRWPSSGRMLLHHAGSQVTRVSTPGPTLHIPGGLDAGQQWITAATARTHALLVVVPPGGLNATGPAEIGTYQPAPVAETDAFPEMIAALAHSHRLTAGLAAVTSDPHLN
ncbi:hypothetical protein F1D05_10175 [Kribbella qitaiheensis]|uniref:Uncharacterized protein n=1 Tax=Kribbella qitaiheensis TaxID=1544730 RepID=A0A7G6WW29_9ACTN|nr:hypothetical protein [Kribbella qitaiheensis]QNE18194.1 hypothetical protein F1D05_10175 [Kribbella qitaiheensis]